MGSLERGYRLEEDPYSVTWGEKSDTELRKLGRRWRTTEALIRLQASGAGCILNHKLLRELREYQAELRRGEETGYALAALKRLEGSSADWLGGELEAENRTKMLRRLNKTFEDSVPSWEESFAKAFNLRNIKFKDIRKNLKEN